MSYVKDTFFGGAEKDAAKAQEAAARQGLALQQETFEESQARLQPYTEYGAEAYRQQAAAAGALGPEAQEAAFQAYRESPAVQFMREQGIRDINRQSIGRGGIGGGERLKALTQFSQGLAMQDFYNQQQRLGGIAQTGLTTATNLGNLGSGFAMQGSSLYGNIGQAQANRMIGKAQGARAGIQGLAAMATGLRGNLKWLKAK
jgi:hypothetical protein